MKEIILFGASGNIGNQTCEILIQHSEKFKLVAISIGENTTILPTIFQQFPTIKIVWCKSKKSCNELAIRYPEINFVMGENGFDQILQNYPAALVINAISGFAGLYPSLQALQVKKRTILLANKESLVLAGGLINDLLAANEGTLYPIDSEHCAIFQCLEENNSFMEIILTASGGMFSSYALDELITIDERQAFQNPNWKMGVGITIDSSTMMNKALEMIEAYHLFKTTKINVVIHPQSILHSAIQFVDSSIIAQLSKPDMKQVISYFLFYPLRVVVPSVQKLDFNELLTLTFQKADYQRWKALSLAQRCLNSNNSQAIVMNAANEQLRELFIAQKIHFYEIIDYIEYFMNKNEAKKVNSYEQIKKLNDNIKREILNYFSKK